MGRITMRHEAKPRKQVAAGSEEALPGEKVTDHTVALALKT